MKLTGYRKADTHSIMGVTGIIVSRSMNVQSLDCKNYSISYRGKTLYEERFCRIDGNACRRSVKLTKYCLNEY